VTTSIVVVGCGNIGSRLLQSVAGVSTVGAGGALAVYVVEPSEAARKMAQERFADALGDRPHTLMLAKNFTHLPETCQLAIIATDARNRLDALRNLTDACRPRTVLLEKFLFPYAVDYPMAQEHLSRVGANAFVNTSRNEWRGYSKLAEWLKGRRIERFQVSGADWNLGSNCIHLLSLYELLNDDQIISLELTRTDAVRDSKRTGYKEISGILTGRGRRGAEVVLESLGAEAGPLVVELSGADWSAVVRESAGEVVFSQAVSGEQQSETVSFEVNFASGMSHTMTALLNGTPMRLPSLEESTRLHLLTMEALNQAFHGTRSLENECPVT